ncbi:hypothetical protein [Ottowia thiooxydans]|uniref:Uncharacterized protein n=1 Tax=Ottowia thiooxydans TaxID=219182 RepID=A0ABV2QB13_9BURK
MSAPVSEHAHDEHPVDPVEEVTKHIPVVLPVAGAIMMFLLAFIAVNMA